MTRANAEQSKFVPWFAKAGAACSIVPVARFVSDHIFALEGGGYGCLFSLTGVDEEGLTLADMSRMLAELQKTAALLAGNLHSTIGLRLLDKQKTFQFFSYLFNLEDWAEWRQLREDVNIDRQIVQAP